MKFNLLSKALMFSGMLAMVACSNDEPATGTGDNFTPNEDGVAYMKVRISSADKMSRATTTPGYEYGDEKENDVKHVRFFFFDKDGASMDLTAYLVNQDDANTLVDRKPQPGEDGKYNNVEAVFAENLLVLENLKSNEYPSYMITILNDDEFRCGTNLNNTLELLDNYKNGDNYVMSTSSYYDGTNLNYHATPLKPTDFKNTPQAAVADGAAVEVYVERLAAKVQLGITATASKNVTYNGESFDIFELSESVSGGNNTDNDADGDVTVLDTKLYLRVIGWALNTTANQSYMCKNLPASDWVSGWKNPAWNIVGDHRSYWGKSYTYGDGAAAIESKVTYTPTKELANNLIYKINDGVAYCNENTNEVANVFSKGEGTDRATVDSRVVTNVVLRTQIVEANGAPVDMVLANGVLFRKNSYLQYILNRAYVSTGDGDNKLSALNVWEQTGRTEGETIVTEYKQIGTEYFTLEFPEKEDYQGLGDVDVVVNEAAFADKKFYSYNPTPAEGESAYTEITDMTPVIAEIKTKIAAVQPEGKNHAVIYDNGSNIYYIPVEHLGADANQETVIEGYYGVVRNHWYKLNITSFSKVGHGLWEPGTGKDEETKPEQPEDPLYYLGAHINILSWKVVNQDVEL